MDYRSYLDAEIWAFLKRTADFYPPDAVDLSIAEQRAVYDRMCAAFDAGRPDGVGVRDLRYGGVPCRHYTPREADGTVFYCHGGGFVVGGLESHDSICAELAARTGMALVAVDYPLSPEHPHPQDFDAARQAFLAVLDICPGPMVLCGDSAGGNLVAAIAHTERARDIAGQVLIYPGLGGPRDAPSYRAHAEAPGLTLRDLEFYETIRTGGVDKTGDPTWAPLQDRDFAGLPPSVILTAECDPLSSDGAAYAAAVMGAGGRALWHEEAGLVHGHLRARHMSARAGRAFDHVIESLTSLRVGGMPDLAERKVKLL